MSNGNAFEDIFGGLMGKVNAANQPAPDKTTGADMSRIANAVELSAALQAYAFFERQQESASGEMPDGAGWHDTEKYDAAQRAMDKIAPIIQLRTSRICKGGF